MTRHVDIILSILTNEGRLLGRHARFLVVSGRYFLFVAHKHSHRISLLIK